MRHIRVRSYFLLILSVFLAIVGPISSVTLFSKNSSALDQATLDIFAENNIIFYDPSEQDCNSITGGDGTIYGNTIEEKIWVGLLNIVGLTEEQAAGAMGNMFYESSFNPAGHEGAEITNHQPGFVLNENPSVAYGLGLIQWSFQRRIDMYNYVGQQDSSLLKYLNEYETYSPPDYSVNGKKFLELAGDAVTNALIQYELEFLRDELQSYSRFKGIYEKTTVSDASDFWLEKIEAPRFLNYSQRAEKAQNYYDQLHGKTISGGVTSANTDTTSFSLLSDHTHITFYSSSAGENAGYAGKVASSINGGNIATGMVAVNGGDSSLAFGDVVYIETTADKTKEGSYAHGKYFIVADTGGSLNNIDIYHDPASENDSAPFGSTNSAKVYKVASGVSWEEYQSKYVNGSATAVTNTDSTGQTVTIIGDSITEAARNYGEITKLLPDADVDAVIGRSWQDGLKKLETLPLRNNVVFAHGSNNISPHLTKADIDDVISAVQDRNLYFITNYDSKNSTNNAAYEENNKLFSAAAAEHQNVYVIDWKTSASADPFKYLEDKSDGLHPTKAGAELWTTLVANAVKGSATASGPCGEVHGNVSALQEYVLKYAWPEWKGDVYHEAMPDYAAVVKERQARSAYVGGCNGEDCGGFVTTLLQESGYETGYNYLYASGIKGSGTVKSSCDSGLKVCQWRWVKEHWTLLNKDENTEIDTGILQAGDVAIVPRGHTFIYVGDIPGFDEKNHSGIASASYCDRMPMAGTENLVRDNKKFGGGVVLWYRKGV